MFTPAVTASSDPPIACTPKALDESQRARQKTLLAIIQKKVMKTEELSHGYALKLPNDHATFLEAAEWVSLERKCCAFAEFNLEWRLDDSVWVKLTGKEGVKEVLAAEMGLSATL
jgi:hypothetical protein